PVRGSQWAPEAAMAIGILLCLAFAYDVPRLMVNAVGCMRLRLPLLSVRRCALSDLPPEGRVRVSGIISSADGVPYQRGAGRVQAAGFVLSDQGASARIDIDPQHVIVEGEESHGQVVGPI